MSLFFDIQTTIEAVLREHTPLTNILAKKDAKNGVYDGVPQTRDSADVSYFPYVTVGEDIISPMDTDTTKGISALLVIHSWSRQPSFSEIKRINSAIYTALHKQEIEFSGLNVISLDFESSSNIRDPDGITRHGTIELRLTAKVI